MESHHGPVPILTAPAELRLEIIFLDRLGGLGDLQASPRGPWILLARMTLVFPFSSSPRLV